MLSWLKPSPLLSEQEQQWLIDTFLWAVEHFDYQYFKAHSQLVLPNNDFFAGQSQSVAQMAEQVFTQVKSYSGLQNWPIALVAPQAMVEQTMPVFSFAGNTRGEDATLTQPVAPIYISYNPQQINQPQDLIASFAQVFARIMIYQKGVLPPGGKAYLDPACEVVASFFGFGIMLSNTVYQFRGGCGKCYNPYANRTSELTEQQHAFLLALFCQLKNQSGAPSYLKGHIRSYYKKSTKMLQTIKNSHADPLLLSLLESSPS